MTEWTRSVLIGVAWVAAAASLGWWSPSQVRDPQETRLASRDTWHLDPLPPRLSSNERLVTAATAAYWGAQPVPAVAAAASAPLSDLRWRLAGVVGQGEGRRVLVLFSPASNKPPALLKVGDKLPTDHLISQINEKTICVQIGKKKYVLGLESIEATP